MRRAKPLLGTFVEIGVSDADSNLDEDCAFNAIQHAFTDIEILQNQLSFHSLTSELTQLNCRPGQWISLSRTALRLLRLARGLMLRSQGAFNITCGGTLVAAGKLPNPYRDKTAGTFLDIGNASDIVIRAGGAMLLRPVLITLDGIAKGYAVDLAIARLKSYGLKGGWVNAGGDLKVYGDASLSVLLRSGDGFENPLTLNNSALASSKAVNDDDARFPSMLVGPTSNETIQRPLISVQAKHAWKADALTKVVAFSSELDSLKILTRCNAQIITPYNSLDKARALCNIVAQKSNSHLL